MQSTLEAQKKEEQAIEALKNELDTKRSETEELRSTVTQMQSQVDAKDYDIKRLKEDRDQLMSHYQQQLKKASEELAIERREQSRQSDQMQCRFFVKFWPFWGGKWRFFFLGYFYHILGIFDILKHFGGIFYFLAFFDNFWLILKNHIWSL